jgi:hypothetical protein
MNHAIRCVATFAFACAFFVGLAGQAAPLANRGTLKPAAAGAESRASAIRWLTNYDEAMERAELDRKMLLVYFYDVEPTENQIRLENEALPDRDVLQLVTKSYVAVRVPVDVEFSPGAGRLVDHEAFHELHGRAGVAVIDFAHEDENLKGFVVSILPLHDGKYFRFDPSQLLTTLELPAGTLSQRTIIFAVRIHPEKPLSTVGLANENLFTEARDHSRYQARLRKQGHHNWGSRFQRITSLLPRGLLAKEVVAESWPGEGIVDAAVDCVHCWRQSSGHWSAVRASHPQYGYDMKKGNNGIWYATGLFGNAE